MLLVIAIIKECLLLVLFLNNLKIKMHSKIKTSICCGIYYFSLMFINCLLELVDNSNENTIDPSIKQRRRTSPAQMRN